MHTGMASPATSQIDWKVERSTSPSHTWAAVALTSCFVTKGASFAATPYPRTYRVKPAPWLIHARGRAVPAPPAVRVRREELAVDDGGVEAAADREGLAAHSPLRLAAPPAEKGAGREESKDGDGAVEAGLAAATTC